MYDKIMLITDDKHTKQKLLKLMQFQKTGITALNCTFKH